MTDQRLRLHEEVMLLALRDERGTVASGTMYSMALGGAVLAELLLRERVGIEKEGRKTFARVRNPSPLGDPLLDDCLQRMRDAKRRGSLQTWVSRFANIRQLRHRVARGLASRGILRADEEKILLIFTRTVYPELDPGPEREIHERLRQAIFNQLDDLDPRTVVLVALAHHASLLELVFEKRKLKSRKQRIETIIRGNAIGKATRQAIEAVQAAVMVATITPIITSS